MPGFGGLATAAAQLWASAFTGQDLLWLPRYGKQPAATYGIAAPYAFDPHAPPSATPNCPVCFSATLQRPQSSVCTTCFGTGFTGGFAAAVSFGGSISTGTYAMRMEETGELVAVTGEWLRCDPTIGPLMPQDLIVDQDAPTVRYLIGEQGQYLGLAGVAYGRLLPVLPQAPDSPWQLVPLP